MPNNWEYAEVVERLASLYDHGFGGKPRGRYRLSTKLMCRMLNQKRVWPDQIEAIRRGLFETGHLLIEMDSFFVVISWRTFSSYRRLNEASIATLDADSIDGKPATAPEIEEHEQDTHEG